MPISVEHSPLATDVSSEGERIEVTELNNKSDKYLDNILTTLAQ